MWQDLGSGVGYGNFLLGNDAETFSLSLNTAAVSTIQGKIGIPGQLFSVGGSIVDNASLPPPFFPLEVPEIDARSSAAGLALSAFFLLALTDVRRGRRSTGSGEAGEI